jgi:hypothetical protein
MPVLAHHLALAERHIAEANVKERQQGEQIMDIKRSGSQLSGEGPAEYFTGMVRINPLFHAPIQHVQ